MEATGSRWKLVEASGRNSKKLEVSVESMEVFTTSMEAPTTSMQGSINLDKNIYFYEENHFKVRETCKNCTPSTRDEDMEAFCHKL